MNAVTDSRPAAPVGDGLMVEIWADLICPWCWIGKRRFEAALRGFAQGDAVRVVHRAFRLMPGLTPQPIGEMMQRRFGPGAHRRMLDEITALAAQEGLTYRLDEAQVGDTRDVHRLVLLAAERGIQPAVVERFYAAYFTDRRSLFDPEGLIALAGEAGLDESEARSVLASQAYEREMASDLQRIGAAGVGGVPFFLFGGRIAVQGAQTAAHFHAALEQAWRTREDAGRTPGLQPDDFAQTGDGAACQAPPRSAQS